VYVFDKIISGYYDCVHSRTGMAQLLVSYKDMLRIWKKMMKLQGKMEAPPM